MVGSVVNRTILRHLSESPTHRRLDDGGHVVLDVIEIEQDGLDTKVS